MLKRILLLVLGTAVPSGMAVAAQTVASHCAPQEKITFSCVTTKTKIVSVCSSPSLSSNKGYVQYRFGFANKLEFAYPKTNEHPSAHFQYGIRPYAGGGAEYLQFRNDEYTYVVFSAMGRLHSDEGYSIWQEQGVIVKKSGKQIAYIECAKASRGASQLGADLSSIIPRVQNEDDFKLP